MDKEFSNFSNFYHFPQFTVDSSTRDLSKRLHKGPKMPHLPS